MLHTITGQSCDGRSGGGGAAQERLQRNVHSVRHADGSRSDYVSVASVGVQGRLQKYMCVLGLGSQRWAPVPG